MEDTWTPEEEAEVEELLDAMCPTPGPRERFLARRKAGEKVEPGLCSYCEGPTRREFCSVQCERNAALAPLNLKFHE